MAWLCLLTYQGPWAKGAEGRIAQEGGLIARSAPMRGGVGFLRELYKMPLADIYGRFREIPTVARE